MAGNRANHIVCVCVGEGARFLYSKSIRRKNVMVFVMMQRPTFCPGLPISPWQQREEGKKKEILKQYDVQDNQHVLVAFYIRLVSF